MLSSDELNVFLRDERAWRRAAQRPMEDDASGTASLCSKEANWLIFRRGTSDNAFSLKFANSLRATFTSGSINTASTHTRPTLPRRRWDASARCVADDGTVIDPLQQLLSRNLQRRRSKSKPAAPQTRATSALREREYQRVVERVTSELADLERAERREMVAAFKARRKALATAFFSEVTNLLFLDELNSRRVLFRAWQEEKYTLFIAMRLEQERLTSMTSHQFKRHCRLLYAETLKRNRIVNDEKECRDLLQRYAYVEYLKSLEAEIEACRRKELQLLRRIA